MKAEDLTGRQFSRLTVIEKAINSDGNGAKWLCHCSCGNTKVVAAGSLRSGNTRSCGCFRKERAAAMARASRGTHLTVVPKYSAAHARVISLRGKADEHSCVDCSDQAFDWSYNHEDPNQLFYTRSGYTMPYSADPSYYEPRCVPCHRSLDAKRAWALI